MKFKKGHSGNPNGRPKGSKNKNPNRVNVGFAKDLVNDLIGTFKTGRFYVYKHILDGICVYIGKGKGDRAWSPRRTLYEHSNLVKEKKINVRIIASDLSEEEALAIEYALIKLRKPIYNSTGLLLDNELQATIDFKVKQT